MRRLMALLLLLAVTEVCAEELLIVVSTESPIETLTQSEVANIFLGRINHLDKVGRITPLAFSEQQSKDAFYQKISGKSPAQLNSYWTTLIFTGKGKPPKEFISWEKLLSEIYGNPTTITYLPAEQLTSKLKVVYTIH